MRINCGALVLVAVATFVGFPLFSGLALAEDKNVSEAVEHAKEALAQDRHADAPVQLAQSALTPTEGAVRKIDGTAAKITLSHGEIKNLGMKAMTMVFNVADPTQLANLKEGDKVTFTADKVGGAFTVITIAPEK